MSDLPIPTIALLRQRAERDASGALIWSVSNGRDTKANWWNGKVAGKPALVAKRDTALPGYPQYGTLSGYRIYLREALHALDHGCWPDGEIDWSKRSEYKARPKVKVKAIGFPNSGLMEEVATDDCTLGWSCAEAAWFTEIRTAGDGSADVEYHDTFDAAVQYFKSAFEAFDLI